VRAPRNLRAELDGPAADHLAGHLDAPRGQHLLDVPEAQGEADMEPYRVADDLRREAVALERQGTHEPQLHKDSARSNGIRQPDGNAMRPPFRWFGMVLGEVSI
jgi:hypothetical protein